MAVQVGRLLGIARKAKPKAGMEELDAVEIGVDFGVAGDWRGHKSGSKLDGRQVSVMTIEDWKAACADVGEEAPWTVRRANLLVDRLILENAVGAMIQIGDVILRVTEETAPCNRMDGQVEGLTDALMPNWRGGVCCMVEHGGTVKLGHEVTLNLNSD